jgi:hypothetical protein
VIQDIMLVAVVAVVLMHRQEQVELVVEAQVRLE